MVAIPNRNIGSVSFEFPEPSHAPADNLFGLPRYRGAGESIMHLPPPQVRTRYVNEVGKTLHLPHNHPMTEYFNKRGISVPNHAPKIA